MRRKAGLFTIQGVWIPDKAAPLPASDSRRSDETPLETEMRLFGGATRWAVNRLLEGCTRKELKVLGQAIFHLNSGYVDDAILKAQEIIDSPKELIPLEIEETAAKRAKKKIKRWRRRREGWRPPGALTRRSASACALWV